MCHVQGEGGPFRVLYCKGERTDRTRAGSEGKQRNTSRTRNLKRFSWVWQFEAEGREDCDTSVLAKARLNDAQDAAEKVHSENKGKEPLCDRQGGKKGPSHQEMTIENGFRKYGTNLIWRTSREDFRRGGGGKYSLPWGIKGRSEKIVKVITKVTESRGKPLSLGSRE